MLLLVLGNANVDYDDADGQGAGGATEISRWRKPPVNEAIITSPGGAERNVTVESRVVT